MVHRDLVYVCFGASFLPSTIHIYIEIDIISKSTIFYMLL